MEKKKRIGWSDEELKAAIEAYATMKRLHQSGETFVKSVFFKRFTASYSRSEASFQGEWEIYLLCIRIWEESGYPDSNQPRMLVQI